MANSPSPIWPQTPRRRQGLWNYPRPHRTGIRAWVPSWRFVVGSALTVLSLGVGVFVAGWIGWSVPPERAAIGSETTTVYYANDTVMGKFAAVDRTIRGLDEMPPYVGKAVLASEDQNFENHLGVDPLGMVRALVNNVTNGSQQGGSTLTQQYVENTYFEPGETSYADKFREVILALKVEQSKSKDEILEGYVNSIYLGRGAYGFEAAAKAYFDKPAAELTVSETAMLVGIIPSPSYWDPRFGEESRAVAETKWARVLRNMAEMGIITEEDRAAATFPDPIEYKPVSRAGQTGYLLEEVRKELASEAGLEEEDLMTNGYEIHTTINPKWQKAAVEAANTIPYKGENAASDRLGVSIVSVDPENGAIRALYGGKDYEQVQFNAATDGKAQGGSTFKPFTLIGALEEGHELEEYYTGNSPMQIPGWSVLNKETGVEEEVELTNFGTEEGGDSFGDINLIDATADSVNTVYAQLNVEIGAKKSQDVAIRAGIPEKSTNAELSNVLGTSTVRAVDLAGAYATFAAQGTRTTPHIVTNVKDGEKLLYEGDSSQNPGAIDPDVMTKATYAMQQVVEKGSGEPAQELLTPDGEPRPVAGKTGSTNDNKSAWFAGYVPQLATVVGLYQMNEEGGEETITPFGDWANYSMTGGTWPVTAWTQYMNAVTKGMEVEEFPEYVPPAPPEPTNTPSPTNSETAEPETVMVPGGLVGQQFPSAVSVLSGVNLVPAQVGVESPRPAGEVLNVENEGQEVPVGSTIQVHVSTGPAEEETTDVPGGLVGSNEGSAQGKIQGAGLQPVVEYRDSADVAEGTVIEVSPGEGTPVPPGSQVRVIVSSGPGDVFPTGPPTGPGDDGDGGGGGGGGGRGNGP